MSMSTFTDRDEALKFARSNNKDEVFRFGDNLYIVPLRPTSAGMLNAPGNPMPLDAYWKEGSKDRIYFGGIPR